MKKLLLFVILASLLGCENIDQDTSVNNDTTVEGEVSDQELTDYVLPDLLYASLSGENDQNEDDPVSRTYVGPDGHKVLWHNGDAVSFFAVNIHNAKYTYTGEDGVEVAELLKDEDYSGESGSALTKSLAVYPYNEDITVETADGVDRIHLTYPSTQKHGANSFGKNANIMIAAGKNDRDEDLYFRNACGYLVLKIFGKESDDNIETRIKSVTLESLNDTDKIAGPAVVTAYNDAPPTIEMTDDASTSVTLDCTYEGVGIRIGAYAENATEFCFCLPPVTLNGMKVTVTDIYGNTYTKKTEKTVNIVRNEVQPMKAFEVVSDIPNATKIWYTRENGNQTPLSISSNANSNPFNATIARHEWDPKEGKIIMEFLYPIREIPSKAFQKTDITTITLSEGIRYIRKEAFRATKLTEITIPGSVWNIEEDVFYDCNDLASVTFLPNPINDPLQISHTISTLGWTYGTFYYTKLTTINLDRELEYVDKAYKPFTPDSWNEGIFAVENYEQLGTVNVTLGSQVKTLSNYMFNWLPIENITIPGTVETIGNCVFDGCKSLTTLTYEPSPTCEPLTHGFNDDSYDEGPFVDSPLTTVNLDREIIYTYPESNLDGAHEGLFGNKSSLTNITLGDNVKTLTGYMFAKSGVTSINLNKVQTIGKGALMGVQITDVNLPSSVTNICDYAFADCNIESVDLNNVTTIGKYVFRGAKFSEITIPASVTSIGDYAFLNCNSLSKLTFASGASDLTIGFQPGQSQYGPFYQSPLTEIIVNRSIVLSQAYENACDEADEGVFSTKHGNQSTTITLGGQVAKIPEFMFSGLPLTSITIPGTVAEISNDAFTGCVKLKSVIFEDSNAPLKLGYNNDSDPDGPFYDCPLESVVLNREVNYTFPNPDTADEGLFGNKTKLTSITLGDNVKTLSGYMFANAGVTSFNLNKVTTIGNGALSGIKFTDLTIPASVTSIGDNAFYNCSSLANLTFASGASDLTIGFQPGTAQYGPFYQSPLAKIVVNRSLILTQTYADACDSSNEGVFSTKYGSQSTTISLGGQVAKIPEFMFGCLPITEMVIPATVTEISNDAFTDCNKLKSIIFAASSTPLKVGYNTVGEDEGLFAESPLETVVLNREIDYTFPNPDVATEGLFGNKPTLTSITLGDNVKTLSGYMFANAGVTSFDLKKVNTIGNGALSGVQFSEITIPETVTSIGDNAFKDCRVLSKLTFASGTSDLTIGFQPGQDEVGPFYQSPLADIVVNRSLVLTNEYASACDEVNEGIFSTQSGNQSTTISLGGQVAKIPEFMFSSLPLTSITIPKTVTEISNDAFTNCTSLSDITFDGGSEPLTIGYNTIGNTGPFGDSPLTKVTLNRQINYTHPNPDTATKGLFGNKPDLTKVLLGYYVRHLSDYMFANAGIESIGLQANVETIGKGVFSGSKLTRIVIPKEITSIGANAFLNCDYLAEVNIQDGSSALTVGYQNSSAANWGPFYDSPLSKIYLGREINYVDGNGNTFTPSETNDGFFANEESGSITNVSVTLSNNVKTISNYMFSGLKMNDINIPSTVTEIGNGAFYGCNTFSSLTIPSSVTKIGDNAFYNCSSLSNLTIASGANTLTLGYQPGTDERGPFYQSPLSTIKVDRPIAMTDTYKIYCDQSDEGIFSNSSYNSDLITKVEIGSNVKEILPYMFARTAIQQLHFPTAVDKIGVYVIKDCPKLNAIVFYDEEVRPEVADYAFGEEETVLEGTNLRPVPPGNYQYYIFTPYKLGRLGSLYSRIEDFGTYWSDLHGLMVDDQPKTNYAQPHQVDKRSHESRYLDIPGYEWYRKRYYDYETITPPTI